jgi:hypothetical protein
MKVKTIKVDKKPIEELTGAQLEQLKAFEKSKDYKLLKELADMEKYYRYRSDFLNANTVEEMNFQKGFSLGIDYVVDTVQRAKEELKTRGDKVDSEE